MQSIIKIVMMVFLAQTIIFADQKNIVLSGPIATASHPFFKIIEDNSLNDVASKVEFKVWNNPDELRAMLLNKQVDFVAIPTNVAANLYNKKIPLELMNISVWGILDIVSRDFDIKSIEDLKGKEIVIPFRGDMPDIIFQALLKKAGMDAKKDVTLKFVPTPPDAVTSLMLRQSDTVLLAEPATSMVMRKTDSFPLKLVAPELKRVLNIEDEWGRVTNTENKLPIAGIATFADMDEHTKKRVDEEYKKALEWYKQNPKEAAALTAKYLKMFDKEVIEDSIGFVKLEYKSAQDAKEKCEHFFGEILEIEPKLIGGKLPESGFYSK
ncbi:MAG: PhnD/SsuA/transferrin family substrate-binding protein [Sulfurovum sp.]|nr:PhnD/SsuA/transferrin family substrate-binding protein [Sulfurovum sp.]